MALDQHEPRVIRKSDCDQVRLWLSRLEPRCDGFVPLGRYVANGVTANAFCCIERLTRAARDFQPPLPVDVTDREHFRGLQRGPRPVDVFGHAIEQTFPPKPATVPIEQGFAIGALPRIVQVRAAHDRRIHAVLAQERE